VTAVTLLGYLASALVFATFWMKAPVRLRQVGIVSNVAFFAYGVMAHAYPVAILHAVLFPLNIWRLTELLRLEAKVREALAGEFSLEWIGNFGMRRDFKQGETIFHRGDAGDEMYYVLSGTISLPEIDITIGSGALLGEMVGFSADRTRAMSAECETDVQLLAIGAASVQKLFYLDPRFGFYLIRLITQRLEQDVKMLDSLLESRRYEQNASVRSKADTPAD
jgi:CRP/FNR family transcriptional regulator, cyclic AMP receptor protein